MKTYLVGGAVRDRLMGLDPKDRDYCVVDATPEKMQALGFKPVGKDFPVFLHPETGEEYALARTERKTALGHQGFSFCADGTVRLEDDLRRRDLTINAMAMSTHNQVIDPYGGQQDLSNQRLRHVSEAFAEDPLRVLRTARFAARFPGFEVATETNHLMQKIVTSGELKELTPERVFGELSKALAAPAPHRFVEVLRDCGALQAVFPEIDCLFGVPQPEEHHPEIDTGAHVLLALQQAAQLSVDPRVRFAALMHDLGKGITPEELWPKHPGHEKAGVPLVEAFCERWRVPKDWKSLALTVTEHHGAIHRYEKMSARGLRRLLERMGAYRNPDSLPSILAACEADARGRKGLENRPYDAPAFFEGALRNSVNVSGRQFIEAGYAPGPQIRQMITQERVRRLKTYLNNP